MPISVHQLDPLLRECPRYVRQKSSCDHNSSENPSLEELHRKQNQVPASIGAHLSRRFMAGREADLAPLPLLPRSPGTYHSFQNSPLAHSRRQTLQPPLRQKAKGHVSGNHAEQSLEKQSGISCI